MKILLTGASGFLGNIIKTELEKDNIVYTLGRKNADFKFDLSRDNILFKDLFDVVILCAGIIKSESKSDYYNINVVGTQRLLDGFSLNLLPAKLVFISSVSIYGILEDENLTSESNTNDLYAKSKLKAEKIIQEWCNKRNVICTILRLPLVVGNNPPGNLGAMIKGIQKGYYFNIGGGTAKKSMVLAEDVAKIIIEVAKIGGTYNLTDGYHPTFAEIANNISFQLGKGRPPNIPLWLARIIAKFGDLLGSKAPLNTNKLMKITSDLTFDDTKAREAFGWNPTPVLKGFRII
jgi:nucleoside-diphosphate-sugar epimerase